MLFRPMEIRCHMFMIQNSKLEKLDLTSKFCLLYYVSPKEYEA